MGRGAGEEGGTYKSMNGEAKVEKNEKTYSSLPISSGATETLTPAIKPFFSSNSICGDEGVGSSPPSPPCQSLMAVNAVSGPVVMVSTEGSAAI